MKELNNNMNLSSIVINISVTKVTEIQQKLKNLCEVHHSQGNKLIAIIEAETTDEEIKIIRLIENVDGVKSVEMAFSYSENELEKIRKDIELQDDVPKWLNDDSISAKQIDYHGDLKKKF